MKLKVYIIDAFTDKLFKGNSAAVILLEDWLDDTIMQNIAMQNNLAATAFVVKKDSEYGLNDSDGNSDSHDIPIYHIRWFTPSKQIALCGHATLAAAYVVFNKHNELFTIQFNADSAGSFLVRKTENGKFMLDFPSKKPVCIYSKDDNSITPLINSQVQDLVKGLYVAPIAIYQNEQAYYVIYDNEDDVLNFIGNVDLLVKLTPHNLVVTCSTQPDNLGHYDFISRYFKSVNGDEDPVTGSVHTGLAPLWAERLGKDTLLAYQASSRGGELECTVQGDRVLISGNAVRYLTGMIEV